MKTVLIAVAVAAVMIFGVVSSLKGMFTASQARAQQVTAAIDGEGR